MYLSLEIDPGTMEVMNSTRELAIVLRRLAFEIENNPQYQTTNKTGYIESITTLSGIPVGYLLIKLRS